MCDNEEITCALFISLYKLLQMRRRRKQRRWRSLTVFNNRNLHGGNNLLTDLEAEDSGKFNNFCRMSSMDFETLHNLIESKIMKEDTNYRTAISSRERLAITLRFLATGDSYTSLQYLFKVSQPAISGIVPEVCDALIESLRNVIKLPKSEEEWLNVSKKFEDQWNFPHCCGSLDGKHVVIQAPIDSGSEYNNYKSTFSIVLMALVDADCCFQYVDVSCQGRISDRDVFQNTKLFSKLRENTLHLPPSEVLKGRKKAVPYAFLANEAFPMQEHIIKPYAGSQKSGSSQRIFNYRLSRARRTVENAFGILSVVFRVLRKPIRLQPHKAKKVILACVYLHNFLRKSKISRSIYTPIGSLDQENGGILIQGTWRNDQDQLTSLLPFHFIGEKPSTTAVDIRNEFAEYFLSEEGRVPWQNMCT